MQRTHTHQRARKPKAHNPTHLLPARHNRTTIIQKKKKRNNPTLAPTIGHKAAREPKRSWNQSTIGERRRDPEAQSCEILRFKSRLGGGRWNLRVRALSTPCESGVVWTSDHATLQQRLPLARPAHPRASAGPGPVGSRPVLPHRAFSRARPALLHFPTDDRLRPSLSSRVFGPRGDGCLSGRRVTWAAWPPGHVGFPGPAILCCALGREMGFVTNSLLMLHSVVYPHLVRTSPPHYSFRLLFKSFSVTFSVLFVRFFF